MERKYRIGEHEFDSREEWEKAIRDLKKIKAIVDQTDIDNPKEALFLYNLIRDGKITFSSELGAAFFCDISDRVAENSKKLLDEKSSKKKIKNKQSQKSSKKPVLFQMIGICCVGAACISLLCYGVLKLNEQKAVKRLEEVQEEKSISQAVNWYMARVSDKQVETEVVMNEETLAQDDRGESQPKTPIEPEIQEQPPEVLVEYQALKQQYSDLAGWIRIEGTQVDLPVMQNGDNEYYLTRNVDGNEDKNGTLFLDMRNDYLNQSSNLIVYGHNMKTGAMFGGLKQYLDTSYVPGHEMIQFDTIYEKQTYQIIAVCLSEVGYQDDGKYKYYQFIQSSGSEEFAKFLNSIRECAVYDNTQDVTESDKFLTLSTCNSYVEDGRLFIVAKKIQ